MENTNLKEKNLVVDIIKAGYDWREVALIDVNTYAERMERERLEKEKYDITEALEEELLKLIVDRTNGDIKTLRSILRSNSRGKFLDLVASGQWGNRR